MDATLAQRLSDLERRVANLHRVGTVVHVDPEAARIRVRYATDELGNPVLSGWLPWFEQMAGADRTWSVPETGEQVMLLAPNGDLAQAIVLRGILQDAFPAKSEDANDWRVDWSNGSFMHHNRDTGVLTLNVNQVRVPNGDVFAGSISLKHHQHSGVKRGFDQTGQPV